VPARRAAVADGPGAHAAGGRPLEDLAGTHALGLEPLRQLNDEVVKPVAVAATQGAWYSQWRLVSLDGSTMDVADEQANDEAFGRPGASRGSSAYPQFRFVSLVQSGTHVLFGTRMASYATGENTLAKDVLRALDSGMLCLADRGFFGYAMWRQARATKAQLLCKRPASTVLTQIVSAVLSSALVR